MQHRNQSDYNDYITEVYLSEDGLALKQWTLVNKKNLVIITWKRDEDTWEEVLDSGSIYDFDKRDMLKFDKSQERAARNLLDKNLLEFLNKHPKLPTILDFLNQLKTDKAQDEKHQSSIQIYQLNGTKEKFLGITESSKTKNIVKVDDMMRVVRKSYKTYVEDKEFIDEISKLRNKFKSSVLTPIKKVIIENFIAYHEKNSGKFVSRAKLVECWVDECFKKFGVNPFEELRKQRRIGCLSIFNPQQTDSIKLFNKFLLGEAVSARLEQMINGLSQQNRLEIRSQSL